MDSEKEEVDRGRAREGTESGTRRGRRDEWIIVLKFCNEISENSIGLEIFKNL